MKSKRVLTAIFASSLALSGSWQNAFATTVEASAKGTTAAQATAAQSSATQTNATQASSEKSAGTAAATKSYPKTEAGVYARVNDLRTLAKSIKIDGKANDWAGFPMMVDVAGDTTDASRDIVRTAVAPTDDALYIMIATKGAPSKENLAFWFDVDYMGGSSYDYEVGLTAGSTPRFWIFPEKQERITSTIEGVEFKVDEVVEIKIPHTALVKNLMQQPLTQKMTQFLHGPIARSWVRVRPASWSTASQTYVDFGAAAASFRLAFPLAGLDSHLVHPESATAQIEMPVRGKWFIFEGTTHTGERVYQWSCKLNVVDAAHNHASTTNYPTNEQNFCWDKPVYAPCLGIVNRVRSDLSDLPHALDRSNQPANEVLISMSHSHYLVWLSSLRKDSVSVQQGQSLAPGFNVGTVGNSSTVSPMPHLHVDVSRYIGDRTTVVPMEFRNVRVGLNFSDDDPWARDLSTWEPREGYFVTPLP